MLGSGARTAHAQYCSSSFQSANPTSSVVRLLQTESPYFGGTWEEPGPTLCGVGQGSLLPQTIAQLLDFSLSSSCRPPAKPIAPDGSERSTK